MSGRRDRQSAKKWNITGALRCDVSAHDLLPFGRHSFRWNLAVVHSDDVLANDSMM
jgi:hypothetical protein